ncbi:MAG: ABC transporter ATP-binding protein [Lachnospiraceae bacterium]
MNRNRTFKYINFLTYPMCCIPFQSLFLIIYTICNALIPAYETIVLADFIDCAMAIFNGKKNTAEIVLPIIMIVLYILFIHFMPSVADLIRLTGKNQMTLKLKELIINKKAALEYMHIENEQTQKLIHRVCAEPVENFSSGFSNILSAASIIISSFSLLVIIMTASMISGVVIVVISIPLFFVAMKTGRKNYEMSKDAVEIQRRYGYLGSVLTEREYAHERKLFGYSQRLQEDYDALYDQSFTIESQIEKKTYTNMKSGSMVTLLLIAVIVTVLLPSLNMGNITIGVFVALVNAIFSLVQTMSWRLSGTMSEYARLCEYLKDWNAFFSLSEKKDACVTPCCAENFVFQSLEFRNVSFRYPGTDIYVLKQCSFVLHTGKSYSFVGVNGAGKSTIVKLITGLYDDYDGEILLNGDNIKHYDYAALKAIISVLFQDFTSYSISMKDNIIIGREMIYDEQEVEKVISQVGLKDLTNELPHHIETSLGKMKGDGVDLSRGQWQRVAIARLLYSAAKINILDEPTAALDPIAESQVYEMFHKVNHHCFTIYITHRLGAAKISDEILVVHDGKIAECGSHEQLMSIRGGLYQTMFEQQRSWYERDSVMQYK